MKKESVSRQLNYIDWDFSSGQKGTAKLTHWYPGTFTNQLPAALIQSLSDPGDVIFDPYGGIGTSAAEALRLGRRVWYTDLNPIAVLSSYTYSCLLLLKIYAEKDLEAFFGHFEDMLLGKSSNGLFSIRDELERVCQQLEDKLAPLILPTPEVLQGILRKREEMNVRTLAQWIHRQTLNEIESIEELHANSPSYFVKLFTDFMISANLRGLSSQVKSWGHIADNVRPKDFTYKSSRVYFRRWLSGLKNSLKGADTGHTRKKPMNPLAAFSIHDWSKPMTIECPFQSGASAIITSPPYGDAIDYIYSQKLSLYALGYEESEISMLCSGEIGARRKRSRPDSRQKWAMQMADAMITQAAFVEGQYIAAILPHKNHGREIGLNLMIQELAKKGWHKFYEKDRSISQKKTRQSWTSIKMETITIFTRGN